MNVHLPAPRRRWPARLLNLAVTVVVLALAAATFVLSYSGVHAIAAQAGVSSRLARLYPATFDAVLVIACVAAVALRDARWWARCYAWLAIVVVVAAVGWADAVHAMNISLQHRTMEGVVAATPWVLVLLGFSLMLTIFRQSRGQHAPAAPASRRASRRAPGQAELAAVPSALAPPLPLAGQTATDDLAATTEPPASDDHPPTLPVPVLSEAALTAPADVLGEPANDWPAPAGAVAEADGDEAAPPTASEPVLAIRALAEAETIPPVDADLAPGTVEPNDAHAVVRSYFVADSGRQDYWDADEDSGLNPPGYQPADEDAPPFATAPFASVPRLNRVRSTPTPPEDDED